MHRGARQCAKISENLPLDAVSIKRERFVGDGMQDNVVLQNQTMEPVELRLGLELGSDFADVISVKEWDFSLGDPGSMVVGAG